MRSLCSRFVLCFRWPKIQEDFDKNSRKRLRDFKPFSIFKTEFEKTLSRAEERGVASATPVWRGNEPIVVDIDWIDYRKADPKGRKPLVQITGEFAVSYLPRASSSTTDPKPIVVIHEAYRFVKE